MIVAYEFTKRFLIWGVVAVALYPKQHIDGNSSWRFFSIGGSSLSYNYKRLLLAIASINLVRLVLKDSRIKLHVRVFADALGLVQQLGHTFLCFLTPYLLQTWLAPIVNLPGGRRPGSNLLSPLYLSTFLSALSVVLVRASHPNFWFLRKLGNVASSPPVLSTLTLFNSVTTPRVGLHHDGRGTIISQTLAAVEYWFVATQLLCAVGFAFDRRVQDPAQWTQLDQLLESFRQIAFVSDWTRILAHSVFINQLDEMYLASSGGRRSSAGGGTASNGERTTASGATRGASATVVERLDGDDAAAELGLGPNRAPAKSVETVSLVERRF